MKIIGQESVAFVLASSQAAIAMYAKPADNSMPMVQIVGMGMGVCVVGVDALEALRQAIDFAIEGP